MASESLHDVAVLIDSLRSNAGSLRQLKRVAAALGQARTRDELIPYASHIDDDELQLVLAEELGGLLPYVGGSAHAGALLGPLEGLTGSDESSVRAAAVVAIQAIISGMSATDVTALMLPMLSRLTSGCYPMRIASCALFANVHNFVSAHEQGVLRTEFETLTGDSHPVVRRAAAANLARLTMTAGAEHIDFFLRIFIKISQDAHESIRRVLIEHAAAFVSCCKKAKPGSCEEAVPHVITLLHDPSWRVRYCAANHVHELAEAFGQEVTRRDLFPHYRSLLKDADADVRGPACQALPTVCKHLDIDVVRQSVRPVLVELSRDSSESVRELLASHIISLAPIFGRQHTIDLLLEPLLTLLRDKTAEVRLNVLRTLHHLSDFITLDQVSEVLLPTLDELSMDKVWRVRHQLVALTPKLGQHLGMVFFQRDLLQRTLQWLTDNASIIRTTASQVICEVAVAFGQEWTRDHVLGRVVAMVQNPNYLYRTSVLYCLRDLSKAVSADVCASHIIPVCITAASDQVPNIRFVAARVLQSLRPQVPHAQAQTQVIPCLNNLCEDSDDDVRFFAGEALAVYNQSGDTQ